MAQSFINRTYRDSDGEASSLQLRVLEITDVNFATMVGTTLPALITAIDAVSIGLPAKNDFIQDRAILAAPKQKATDQDAARESKWLVLGYDSVTYEAFRFEVPCAKVTGVKPDGTDRVDLLNSPPTVWSTLKSAVEASVLTNNGNAPVLTEAVKVGRNL